MLFPWVHTECLVLFYRSYYSYENKTSPKMLSYQWQPSKLLIVEIFFKRKVFLLSRHWRTKDCFPSYPESSSSEGVYVKLSNSPNFIFVWPPNKETLMRIFELFYDKLSSDSPWFHYRNPQTHISYDATESLLRFPDLPCSPFFLHPW